ncbi:MAG: Zn-dependent protease/predicted transcriptional regulator [Saprospiraceae bacterium]|jgi:Zn-dependent protease/predicted transcriptional regulator
MKGAVKILTAFNIPVFVHWSFGLILAYVLFISNDQGFSGSETLWAIITVLGLFFCVTLHEFGHALAARRYGVGTKDIALYPIGGIARLERLPKKPIQEFVVAIAGPLVNFAIALLLLPYMIFMPNSLEILEAGKSFAGSASDFLPAMFVLNLGLGIFNLIPAFPMDGGRIFRALISLKLDRVKATLVAARLGQIIAAFAIFFGLQGELGATTAFIGFFIFMMAQQEYRFVKTEGKLNSASVKDIMREQFTRFFPEEPMYSAINELRKDVERNFLVFNKEEKLVGLLDQKDILKAMKEERRTSEVHQYMTQKIIAVSKEMTLGQVFEVMQDGVSICPVMEGIEVIGVVDVTAMNDFMRKK